MVKVIFTDRTGVCPKIYRPKPAVESLPEWYKSMPTFTEGKKRGFRRDNTPYTAKKCIPVFDALTAGYIIYTWVDIEVNQEDEFPYFSWPSKLNGENPIMFHPIDQAAEHPAQNGQPYPKWVNPWSVKTPSGFSTLFIPPMHNPNHYFTALPGIVDTDGFDAPVQFPFVLNDPKFEGIIPAGTPLIQVIPFRRDLYRMKFGNNIESIEDTRWQLRSVFANGYRKMWWSRKEWR